jgi:hypothetical protein
VTSVGFPQSSSSDQIFENLVDPAQRYSIATVPLDPPEFAQPLHIDCERGDRATSARSRRLAQPRSGQSAADSRPVC